MSNHFPIPSPPDELVRQWTEATRYKKDMPYPEGYEQCEQRLCTAAARWGADQELEACCELVPGLTSYLRAARRPKPPSLAKRALHILGTHGDLSCAEHATLARALEQLDD